MNRNYLREKKHEQVKQKIVSGILYGVIVIIAIVALCEGLSHNDTQHKSTNDTVPVTQTHIKKKKSSKIKHHKKQIPMQIQSNSNRSNSDTSSKSNTDVDNHKDITNIQKSNDISKKDNGNITNNNQPTRQNSKLNRENITSIPVHEHSITNNHSENTNNSHSTTPMKSQKVVMKKIN